MNIALTIIGAVLALVAMVMATVLAYLAAGTLVHVARYRAYRRRHPAADRGQVWRTTRWSR